MILRTINHGGALLIALLIGCGSVVTEPSTTTGTGEGSGASTSVASSSSGVVSDAGINDSYCGSLVIGECGKGIQYDDVCADMPESATKACVIGGKSATCDGNFNCGGNDACLANSDCPYKQSATWHCVTGPDVDPSSPDYHKCKYQFNKDACLMVLAGDDFCWISVPMAALWLCDGASVPEVTAGTCTQPAKDTAPNKWCCLL